MRPPFLLSPSSTVSENTVLTSNLTLPNIHLAQSRRQSPNELEPSSKDQHYTTIAMDQVKQQSSQQSNQNPKPLMSVESYQRRWAQLMEDTNQQIQKIRGKPLTYDLSHLGSPQETDSLYRGRKRKSSPPGSACGSMIPDTIDNFAI